MSTQTPNLGLAKPAGNERPLISVLNSNADKLDAAIGDVDVQIDGSLQEQISSLKNAVSPSTYIGYSSSMGRINGFSASCRWYVVGYDDDSKFDLHLTICINSNTSQSDSVFEPITLQPILTALGKSSFDSVSGKAIAYSKSAGLIYDPVTIGYGLLADIVYGDRLSISRVYDINGYTGGWPTNNAVYQEGVIIEVDIYGAVAS